MASGHVYHWKHGWIPLDHTAALSKAKGNHSLATKYMAARGEAKGITSKQDLAKAALDLPNISDPAHRASAKAEIEQAARTLNAPNPLPKSNGAEQSKRLPIGGWEKHTDALIGRGADTYSTRAKYDAAMDRIKALGGEGKGTPYDAHQRYASSEYGNINGYLQGRPPKNETATVLDIARLDRAFSEAGDTTQGVAVYRRGIRPSPGFDPAEVYKEGTVVQEAGYLSMSTENPQSFRGADGWTMNILVPPGHKTIPGTFNEREVILNRGTTHHVVKVDPTTRTIWIQVTE